MMVSSDQQTSTEIRRMQVMFAARGGCASPLLDAVTLRAQLVKERFGEQARVTVMSQISDDPFPAANPLCRPFEVVLEIQCSNEVALTELTDALGSLTNLDDICHLDLTAALVGYPQLIIDCEPTPLRYFYMMRKKAHSTNHDYFDYYFHSHSRFGFATPNISGYTQFHVDRDESHDAATALGVGSTCCESVSELHLTSLETFFEGIGDGRLGIEAAADEATFVDRENSISFCCHSHVM